MTTNKQRYEALMKRRGVKPTQRFTEEMSIPMMQSKIERLEVELDEWKKSTRVISDTCQKVSGERDRLVDLCTEIVKAWQSQPLPSDLPTLMTKLSRELR